MVFQLFVEVLCVDVLHQQPDYFIFLELSLQVLLVIELHLGSHYIIPRLHHLPSDVGQVLCMFLCVWHLFLQDVVSGTNFYC